MNSSAIARTTVFYLIMSIFALIFKYWICDPEDEISNMLLVAFPTVLCVLFGTLKSKEKNPNYDEDYLDWLRLTPWNKRKSIPFEDCQLKIKDILFVVFLAFMASVHELPFFKKSSVFLFGLSVFFTSYHLRMSYKHKDQLYRIFLFALLPLQFVYYEVLLIHLIVSLTLSGIISLRYQKILQRKLDKEEEFIEDELFDSCYKLPVKGITDFDPRITVLMAVIISYWVICLSITFPVFIIFEFTSLYSFMFFWMVTAVIFSMGRSISFYKNKRVLTSLFGRIKYGRFFIKNHDYLTAWNLIFLLLIFSIPVFCYLTGIYYALSNGIGIFAAIVLYRHLPPGREHWEFTGRYHYTNQDEFNESYISIDFKKILED